MYFSFLVIPTLCALISARDAWGPAVSFGPAKGVIVRAVTTLQPGRAPVQPRRSGNQPQPFLTIWPGMGKDRGNLIQTTLEAHPDGLPRCKEKRGEWCIMASVFGDGFWKGKQYDSPEQVAVSGKQKITIDYKLESNNVNWTQTVTDADTKRVLSKLNTPSGAGYKGWGTGVECQSDCVGTVEPHYYFDTVITFKDPEPGFHLGASVGATYTTPVSEQGGRVWKIAKMTIPAWKNPSGPNEVSTR